MKSIFRIILLTFCLCLCGCIDRDRVLKTFIDDLISENYITIADAPRVSLIGMKTGRRLFRLSHAATTPLNVRAEWRNLAEEIEKDSAIIHTSGWREVVELEDLKDFDLTDVKKTGSSSISVGFRKGQEEDLGGRGRTRFECGSA
jgi:hypothetical protein